MVSRIIIKTRESRRVRTVAWCDVLERQSSKNTQKEVDTKFLPSESTPVSKASKSTKPVEDNKIVTVSISGTE